MRTKARRLDELPELTEEQRARLDHAVAKSDAAIDTSDVPGADRGRACGDGNAAGSGAR